MNLEQRTTALLDLVERYKARRCAELFAPADAEARELRHAAISEARRRVSTAIAEERKRLAAEVGAVEAALATERRLAAQRHAMQLLAGAWGELRRKLCARWQAADTRRQWVEAHLGRALQAVPRHASGWRIEHHAAWSEAERTERAQWLRGQGLTRVEFAEAAGIDAGFRVVCGHNVLDATLDGLLADRAQLEGRLLHHLKEGEAA
ncbi:MAG TPA: hypothetical protein VMK32_01130 [Burkholderiaceae bacterium]|nr:hypothetical protein [Burkholderiaceae bacterium]